MRSMNVGFFSSLSLPSRVEATQIFVSLSRTVLSNLEAVREHLEFSACRMSNRCVMHFSQRTHLLVKKVKISQDISIIGSCLSLPIFGLPSAPMRVATTFAIILVPKNDQGLR